MRVGIVGINHKLADLKLRELLAKVCQKRFGAWGSLHGDHTFVLLSTCNRTEVYFSSEDLSFTHTYLLNILRQEVDEDFDQKLYSYFGYDCFLHLSRVTAGLDSAIVAETEIQGQVKAAYESVLEYAKIPSDLHYLFQKALRIGKKVRSDLTITPGMPDLEHAIYNIGLHLFKEPQNTKVLFVGASDINRKIVHFLKCKHLHNISLCNRSEDPAKEIAEAHSLTLLKWQDISSWHYFDWIIFGTKAPDFLVTSETLPTHCIGQKLVIDLSVPRNVEPALGKDPRITLLNIDQINRTLKIRRQRMTHSLNMAEQLVLDATKKHLDLFIQKENNPFRIVAVSA